MDTAMKSFYMKDNNNKIREWRIGVVDNVIVIEHGELNGSMQRVTEEVPNGKSTRTRDEQILSRVASRISKQKDRGYVQSLSDALDGKATTAEGFTKPMLAQPLKNIKNADYTGAYVQYKYDGNRCLITRRNDELIAYTRNGKRIATIGHILDGIEIDEGFTIDGELYCHGESLQTIASWVKREQENTRRIKYHAYDVMMDKDYSFRLKYLQYMFNDHPEIEVAPTWKVGNFESVQRLFKKARSEGYEGSIVRMPGFGYEDGKRSKGLIKVKAWEDALFYISDIIPSREGWAILECAINPTKKFKVSAPGTLDHKRHIMDNKEQYIGHMARVEYAQLTKDGIPFHPVCTMIDDGEL